MSSDSGDSYSPVEDEPDISCTESLASLSLNDDPAQEYNDIVQQEQPTGQIYAVSYANGQTNLISYAENMPAQALPTVSAQEGMIMQNAGPSPRYILPQDDIMIKRSALIDSINALLGTGITVPLFHLIFERFLDTTWTAIDDIRSAISPLKNCAQKDDLIRIANSILLNLANSGCQDTRNPLNVAASANQQLTTEAEWEEWTKSNDNPQQNVVYMTPEGLVQVPPAIGAVDFQYVPQNHGYEMSMQGQVPNEPVQYVPQYDQMNGQILPNNAYVLPQQMAPPQPLTAEPVMIMQTAPCQSSPYVIINNEMSQNQCMETPQPESANLLITTSNPGGQPPSSSVCPENLQEQAISDPTPAEARARMCDARSVSKKSNKKSKNSSPAPKKAETSEPIPIPVFNADAPANNKSSSPEAEPSRPKASTNSPIEEAAPLPKSPMNKSDNDNTMKRPDSVVYTPVTKPPDYAPRSEAMHTAPISVCKPNVRSCQNTAPKNMQDLVSQTPRDKMRRREVQAAKAENHQMGYVPQAKRPPLLPTPAPTPPQPPQMQMQMNPQPNIVYIPVGNPSVPMVPNHPYNLNGNGPMLQQVPAANPSLPIVPNYPYNLNGNGLPLQQVPQSSIPYWAAQMPMRAPDPSPYSQSRPCAQHHPEYPPIATLPVYMNVDGEPNTTATLSREGDQILPLIGYKDLPLNFDEVLCMFTWRKVPGLPPRSTHGIVAVLTRYMFPGRPILCIKVRQLRYGEVFFAWIRTDNNLSSIKKTMSYFSSRKHSKRLALHDYEVNQITFSSTLRMISGLRESGDYILDYYIQDRLEDSNFSVAFADAILSSGALRAK